MQLRRLVLLSVLLLMHWPLYAQYVGESVRVTGELAEDVYAAGGRVKPNKYNGVEYVSDLFYRAPIYQE